MIEIIKRRWPEATLVIIFHAGLIAIADRVLTFTAPVENSSGVPDPGYLPGGLDFALVMGTMAFGIVWQLLYLGFLATSFIDPDQPREPMELIRIGKQFFWRMLRFQLVFGCAYMTIVLFISGFLMKTARADGTMDDVPSWIMAISSFAAIAALVKPMLLMPALMIVQDRMVTEAFVSLKNYRILEMPKLLKLFFGCFAVIFLLSFVHSLTAPKTLIHYAVTCVYGLSTSFLLLVVSLAAVKFVAQRTDFVLEEDLMPVNIEDEEIEE
jgi:hypothetical protein